MTEEHGLDPTDYHLRLMIERMQRDGRSETAIAKAVRIARGRTGPTTAWNQRTSGVRPG